MRSQKLSELSYGEKPVSFDGMIQQPPIADRIEYELEAEEAQESGGRIEPWKSGAPSEPDEYDSVIEDEVSEADT